MKKLLLSLVGLFVAFAANADRYWIHGQIFGDSGWGSVELIKNETTGKYEKVGQIVPGEFGVKVTEDNGNNQTEWWSGPSGENNITEAGTFPIKSNDNSNFKSTLTGNYTISLDWTAKTLTFTPYTGEIQEGPAYYVLRGDCFGGGWTDMEMTESQGVWTWTGRITSTGTTDKQLGIKKMVDGVQKGWYWAPTDRSGIISDAGTYYVVLQDGDNGKNLKTKVNGEFTFTFNPETLELKVAGENEGGNDFDDDKWYFVGKRNNWIAQEAYELTAGENGEYVLDADWTMNPTYPFKFNNGNFDDDLEFGAQSEENNKVEIDVPYTLLGGNGSKNLYVKESIKNPHIVLNTTTGILTITSRGGDDPIVDPTKKPELYLTGSFQTNPWTLGAARYHFTRDEDIYTLQFSGTLKATDEFKIADNDWDNDVDFGANATGDKVENGVPYTTVQHGTDNNLQLAENLKDPKFVFNLTSGELTVTGEVVEIEEPVEPTVYTYNIHGDIFASAEWTSVKLTEKDGKYVLENRSVEAGKFGIRVLNPEITVGDPQVAWYASAGDGIVTLDTPMSITDSEATDFEIKKGTYTFTLDMEAKTLTVTGQEEEDVDHVLSYRLRGAAAEGGEWKDYLMTEEDGKWSVTLDNALVTFGIRTWCSAHNKQFEFVNSAGENPAANEAGEYVGKVGGSDWTSTLTGKTTYTYDPVTMKLTIANSSVVNPPVTEDNLVYNIHGNIFGDGGWTSKPMIKNAEGKYVLADVEVEKGNFGIRVLDSTITEEGADPQVGWYTAKEAADAAVIIDKTISLVAKDGTDLSITKGIYTFTFDLEAMTLVVTGEEIEDVDPVYAYAIKGAPDWNVQKMTEEDGVWSITLENALSEFGIAKIDIAHNNQQAEWISSADGKDIDAAGDFAAQVEGTNWKSSLTGKTTYTFNPETSTLTVAIEGGDDPIPPTPTDKKYFLVGGFNGWSLTDNQFEKVSDDKYTVSVEQLTGNFKVTVGNWEEASWGTNGEDITVDTPYICYYGVDSSDINLADVVNNAVVTFVPSTGTITITGDIVENIEHDYVYHIHGTVNGTNWETYAMEKTNDNKWSLTADNGFKEFVIKETDNAVPSYERWIHANGDGKIEAKGQFKAAESDTNWTSLLLGKCTYTFDPENMMLTVDGTTGINGIDAEEDDAVYFNLQGQRVAHPDKGIYIRVVNGKSEKVVK